MSHFADRLLAACDQKKTPICVGLDPVYERLPAGLKSKDESIAAKVDALYRFCDGVLRAVEKHVAVVKIQAACFERYHWEGVRALEILAGGTPVNEDLLVILDGKRGDIGISSEHYAAGMLAESDGRGAADALTVNSYLGVDGLDPFLQTAARDGKGLFALVRTSNPGGDALQGLKLADGRTVAEAVAMLMAQAGAAHVGTRGYSLLGAVVGATKATDAARLRELMPQQIFLVPGFGAQGGTADDVRACFNKDGAGAIITASRSILYAYEKPATADWMGAIEQATVKMKKEVGEILSR